MNRVCRGCGGEKPKGQGRKYCDSCTNFHDNKQYQRDYYFKYPERYNYWQVKGRCGRNGIPFNLEPSDIVFPEICPILNIPLFRNTGMNKPSGNSPSVDRIDPTKGYIKGNIQVISQRANVMKNDASVEELQRFAQWVLKTYPLS